MEISDVFISYRRTDVEFVKKLNDALKSEGFEIWIDWEDIPPASTNFADNIKEGIEGADAFIAVLSPNYLRSTYCVDLELGYALELNKKIIPVVYEKFEPAVPPEGIASINWIFFIEHAGQANTFDEGLQHIIAALRSDYEYMNEHTRLFIRAREWEDDERNNSYLLVGDEILSAEAWLAKAYQKTPPPTQLHSDYIYNSRVYSNKRQRRQFLFVTFALIVSLALAMIASVFFIDATNQRNIAQTNEAEANQFAREADNALQTLVSVVRRRPIAAEGVGCEVTTPLDDFSDATLPDWTLLVYIAGETGTLSALNTLNTLELSGSTDRVNIIAQVDSADPIDVGIGTGTQRYYVRNDVQESIIASDLIEEFDEINTGISEPLTTFITWGIENYPAQRYALIVHGGGHGWRGYLGDDLTGNGLTPRELASAFGQISAQTDAETFDRFDLLVFDTDFGGSLETYQAVSPFGRYMVAAPSLLPEGGIEYFESLLELTTNPGMDGRLLGCTFLSTFESFQIASNSGFPYTLALVNLDVMRDFDLTFSPFSETVSRNIDFIYPTLQVSRANVNEFGFDENNVTIDLLEFVAQFISNNPENSDLQNLGQAVREVGLRNRVAFVTNADSNAEGHIALYFPERNPALDLSAYSNASNLRSWQNLLASYARIISAGRGK